MILRRTACVAAVLLSWAMVAVQGQAVMPGGSDDSCASFNSSTPSAASHNCESAQRSQDSMDGGKHVLLSLGSVAGYDSAFNARRNLTASFEGGIAYAGLMYLRPSSFTRFETTSSLVNYMAGNGILQYMNSTAVSVVRMPSAKTSLSFDSTNVFGNDAIRILSLGNGNIDDVSFGIHSGRVFGNQATARFTQQSSRSRWWQVSVRNNFRDFIDDGASVNTLHARAEIQHELSSRAGIGIFEETSIETGSVACSSQSLGVVYERRISHKLAAEGAVAPAVGNKACIDKLSANLYGAVSAQPWTSTSLYVSAFRKLNDSAFSAITYENNIQGGWTQKFGLRTSASARAGWLGGTAPLHVESFSGTYMSGSFARKLAGGFSASLGYQRFNWSGLANVSPTRNILVGSLNWSPGGNAPEDLHAPTNH
jgi:hypothetical protein